MQMNIALATNCCCSIAYHKNFETVMCDFMQHIFVRGLRPYLPSSWVQNWILVSIFFSVNILRWKARPRKEGWIKGRKLSDNRRMRFHCSKPHQGPKCPPICGSQVSHCCMQIVTLISPGQPILGGPYNTTPFSCSTLVLPWPWLWAPPGSRNQSEAPPRHAERDTEINLQPFLLSQTLSWLGRNDFHDPL